MGINISVALDVKNIAIILIAAVEFALGLAILLRSKRKEEIIYFLSLVFILIVWSATIIFSRSLFLIGKIDDFLFWRKFSYIAALFLPIAVIYFFYSFPEKKQKQGFIFSNLGFALLILPAVFLSWLIINNYLIEGVFIYKPEGVVIFNETIYLILSAYLIGYLSLGFWRLIENYLHSSGETKKQLGIVLIGTLVSAVVALTSNLILPWFQIFDYFWFGPLAMIFMITAVAYGMVKYQLLNARLFASEVFTGLIIFILAGEAFFAQNSSELLLRSAVLGLILIFSYFLLKSIYQEGKIRELLEATSAELAEANVKLKKDDQIKTEFLSLASHQLLTPLSTTKGYLAMLLEGSFGEVSDKAKEALRRVFLSNERLIRLVDDFLNISRLEMGRVEYNFSKFDLKNLISELQKEYEFKAKEKNLGLTVVLEGKFPQIYTDREKFYQILSNLTSNAIHYTSNGYVEIKIKFIEDINKFVISVKDTGIGLSPDEKIILFRQFVRVDGGRKINPQGFGLGLYLARILIKGLGGEIWAESEKEKGSVFYIEIPVFPSQKIKTQEEFMNLIEKIG